MSKPWNSEEVVDRPPRDGMPMLVAGGSPSYEDEEREREHLQAQHNSSFSSNDISGAFPDSSDGRKVLVVKPVRQSKPKCIVMSSMPII